MTRGMLSRGDTWWQVVLVPIIVGMFANYKFPKTVRCSVPDRLPIGATTHLPCLQVKKIEPFSPVVGVLSTCVLVGSAVAQCAAPIKAAGLSLQLACATVRSAALSPGRPPAVLLTRPRVLVPRL